MVVTLAALIASENQDTPFTIGLLGDWGSGKSNLMHLLKKNLKVRSDSERFYFADFNAWEYEHTDNITAGVAQEVLNGFFRKPEYKFTPNDKNTFYNVVINSANKIKYQCSYLFKRFSRLLWKLKVRVRFGCKENGLLIPITFLLSIAAGLYSINELITGYDGILDQKVPISLLAVSLFFILNYYKQILLIFDHPLTINLNSYLRLPNYMNHLGTVPMLKRHLRNLCEIIIPAK